MCLLCQQYNAHIKPHTHTLTLTGAQQCPQSYSPWKHLADKKRLRKDVLLRTDNGGGVWVQKKSREKSLSQHGGRGEGLVSLDTRIKTNAQYQSNSNNNYTTAMKDWSSVLGRKKEKRINLRACHGEWRPGPRPRLGRVCCQISAIICTYFTAIPRHRLRCSSRSLRSQFSRTFSKNAQI